MSKNSNARCIIVLVVIAIVCVGLLAVLNDVLYLPPDTTVFNKAAAGTYDKEIKVDNNIKLSYGKIEMIVSGKLTNGSEVIGFYSTGNKFGKADSFSIAVIVNKSSGNIEGLLEIVDGSTGGYSWDETALYNEIGKPIITNFLEEKGLVVTKVTNSSTAVKYAIQAVAEYYAQAFAK